MYEEHMSLFDQVTSGLKRSATSGVSNSISTITGISGDIVQPLVESSIDAASNALQERIFKKARTTAEKAAGADSRTSIDRSNQTMPYSAMLIGRGAEVGQIGRQYQPASTLKLPTKGAKLHNAFAEQVKAWGGVDCRMSFAYKAILPVVFAQNTLPITRYYTHQVFRHRLNGINAGAFADTTTAWHQTLGPDDSLIRAIPPTGSSTATITGWDTSIRSPFRMPQSGTVQWSRFTQTHLENIGWNCNPFKLKSSTDQTVSADIGSVTSVLCYPNAPYNGIDINTPIVSMPGQQPKTAQAGSGTNDTSCYYRSQTDEGMISYQMCNDGTTPVVCDVVITQLKKGEYLTSDDLTNGSIKAIESAYGQGYLNMCLPQRGVINFDGRLPASTDPFTNSQVEFMPAAALKFYNGVQVSGTVLHPFKQVARDQFIIAAGSVKPFKFKLPAQNYYVPDYDQGGGLHCADFTYIVSVAFSTVATPVVEANTAGTSSTIVDRRGNSLNVSITGTYTERPLPCYLSEYNNNYFVNGVLKQPFYTAATLPTITRANIIPPEDATRGTQISSAQSIVGPFTTERV